MLWRPQTWSVVKPPFDIVEILGEGTFGTVVVARDLDGGGRLVAVKIVKGASSANPEVRQRTRDEARLLSRLSHPNIVRVDRLVELEGRPAMVMELARGVSLQALLHEFRGGLPTLVALEAVRRTALALDYAWGATHGADCLRVVHRDIKPSNVILTTDGVFKVVDFGIARGDFSDRETNTDSVVMGSRAYMAPERLDGRNSDPAIDVYSMGVMLFELLTGKALSPSVNPDVHARNLDRTLLHLSLEDASPDITTQAAAAIRGAASYDPERRPRAHAFARTLQEIERAIGGSGGDATRRFAKEVVEPMHKRRPHTDPVTAAKTLEDGDFLIELIRGRGEDSPMGPKVFVFTLAISLAVLSLASAHKASQVAPVMVSIDGASAEVMVWIPEDATVGHGDTWLTSPGTLPLPAGPAEIDVRFEDGQRVRCGLLATPDTSARVVWVRGEPALSVDDGPAIACDRLQR